MKKKKPKNRKKKQGPHKFGHLMIPDDAIVKDTSGVITEGSQCDECRLPGTETDPGGAEDED
jgi:hypothetical protein